MKKRNDDENEWKWMVIALQWNGLNSDFSKIPIWSFSWPSNIHTAWKNSNKSFTCVEKINAVNSSVLFELACDNFKKNTKKCHNFMEREGGELAQCLRHSNQTCWRDLPRVDQFIDVPCSCYHYNTGWSIKKGKK